MAELSSSGEESSEEEDESASPSLRGSISPITSANRQTSGEKQALYSERGYLNSLSRQERRRIKQEIRKGRKLGEIMISKMNTELQIIYAHVCQIIYGMPHHPYAYMGRIWGHGRRYVKSIKP
jgi:hypothetical protein